MSARGASPSGCERHGCSLMWESGLTTASVSYSQQLVDASLPQILLLCGGDKSTQHADIERAHHLADEWRSEKDDDEEE